jgi:hypothetical protein
MASFNEEVFFMCPYCGENVSMLFELLCGPQEYIEDCEVCCSPIKVNYNITNREIEIINVQRLDD